MQNLNPSILNCPHELEIVTSGQAQKEIPSGHSRGVLALLQELAEPARPLAFHFIGLGLGSRKHADRQGAYDSLRSAGFLGLCLSEQKVGNPLRARDYCKRALDHSPNDPIAYFLLGNVNRDLFNARQSCSYLKDARSSYARMLELNPHLDESKNARNYVGQIDGLLPRAGCGA